MNSIYLIWMYHKQSLQYQYVKFSFLLSATQHPNHCPQSMYADDVTSRPIVSIFENNNACSINHNSGHFLHVENKWY